MPLHLPDSVVRGLREERASQIAMAEVNAVCAEFTRELKRIDAYLEMVYWPMRAPQTLGFVNGCYHIVRHNPGAAGTVEPLVGKGGEYREPGSWVFDMLRKGDLWNAEAQRERVKLQKRAQASADRAKAREAEERKEELRDRVNALTRTSVSLNDASPWTQVAGARKARRAVSE
jgi:hypothetical protein